MQSKRIEPLDSEGLPTMAASMDQGQGSSLGDFARAFDLPEPPLPVYLGRYHIQREIARGGMGIILHAYDELLCRDVAIKLLLARHAENSVLFQRFVNEALVTCRLQHPCIVPIYDHGHAEEERPYFARCFASGFKTSQHHGRRIRGSIRDGLGVVSSIGEERWNGIGNQC